MPGSQILLVDDSALQPGFSPSSLWTINTNTPGLQQWYQHSSSWAQYSNESSSTYGSLTVTFEGFSIAFIGNTPPDPMRQNFTVFIDGGDGYPVSYPAQTTYMQWYTSPALEEGTHTITITNMDSADVDYALVSVSNQTNTVGKDILVDSTSDRIIWVGDWKTNIAILIPTKEDFNIDNYPLGNSTRDSTTSGDHFSLEFIGTNISVFGIQRNSVDGVLSMDFSVDGEENTTFFTRSPYSGNDVANTVFFSSPVLPRGTHTLTMNLTKVTGDQSLRLDYIAYSDQGFSSDRPKSWSSGSASPSSSNLPSWFSPPSTSTTSESSSKPIDIKSIVGGVVGGGIVLLLMMAGALFWWRRKRQAYHQDNLMSSSKPFTYQSVLRHTESSVPFATEKKLKIWPQNQGISIEGHTSTAGSPNVSSSSSTLSRPRSAFENHAEIRRRLDEINSLIAQIDQPSITEVTHIRELQGRIEALTEENSRLTGVPPPAYGV